MGLTVTTCAPTLRLTTRDAVKLKLPSAPASADDALFDKLIDRVSDSIAGWCGRVFAREAVTELVPAFGENRLQVERTPIAGAAVGALGSIVILYSGAPVTDAVVDDKERGWLYRQGGFYWTTQIIIGLTGRTRFPGIGDPQPRSEEPRYSVSYVGGWILPSQNLGPLASYPAAITSEGVSVISSDNSFNDSNGGFPELLAAGDIITAAGFTNAGNNGRFIVYSATRSKIVVSATLTTEAAPADPGQGPVLLVGNLPGDIEEACIEEVKSRYIERERASSTQSERAGPIEMQFFQGGASDGGLCPAAAALLRKYQRSGY